jgi:hypothetical protein
MTTTAREAQEASGLMVANINARLLRCESLPTFQSVNLVEARRIRRVARETQLRVNALLQALHREAKKEATSAREEIPRLNREIQELAKTIADLSRSAGEKTAAQTEANAKQARINALQNQLADLDTKGNARLEELFDAPSEDLAKAIEQFDPILDDASTLERELSVEAKERLKEAVRTDFASKEKLFKNGERHHKRQALYMLGAMFAAIALSMLLIAALFFFVRPDAGATPGATGSAAVVEHAILIGAGRIAIIIFAAWAVKYTADLHRSHAEQSVIYRDRRAALGVAEVMLTATPELEQKRDVLKMLSEGYLNFEQSAFRTRRGRKDSPAEDSELQRIKSLAEALKPLVESLKPLLDSAKGVGEKGK